MQKKVGRNDPCPCGSGKKYKKCCLNKSESNKEIQGVVNQKAVKEPVDSLREKIRIFMEKENFIWPKDTLISGVFRNNTVFEPRVKACCVYHFV